ncbi:MAG: hypothetical protein ACR2FY_26295 [Pirellulaceae bacterium]
MLDQLPPLPLVHLVELVPDFLLPLGGSLQKLQRPRLLGGAGMEQAAALEEAIELVEGLRVAQLLQREFLVGERTFLAVVEADGLEVGNDSPGATGDGVEVVPALLDGGAAVGPVAVEVGHGPFEFDHDRGEERFGEFAEGGVGGPHVLHKILVFQLPRFGAGGFDPVAEPLAENLIEKLRVDRRFLVGGKMPCGFQIRPAKNDLVGPVPRLPFQQIARSRFAEEFGDEKSPLTADFPLVLLKLLVKEPATVVDDLLPFRHAVFHAAGMKA